MKKQQHFSQNNKNRSAWDVVWRGHWYSDPNRRLRRSRHKLAVIQSRYGSVNAGAVVCELGCGAGYFTSGLAERNPQIRQAIGCDHSVAALQRAIWNFGADHRLEFVASDAICLPFETNTFDAAFAICALEHMPNMREAIKELSRVLRPNADLFIFFSNQRSFFTWERRIRSLVGEWPYSFQQEITVAKLQNLMIPDFSPVDWCVVTGESDTPLLRRLDLFVHRWHKNWGRYIYMHATRKYGNA